MKIKNFSYILISILILSFTIYNLYLKTLLSEKLKWSVWSYSEWLINYPEGYFVRRGLLGEFFIFLANGKPLFEIIQSFVFFNFIIFIALVSIAFFLYGCTIRQYCLFLFSAFGFFNLVSYDISYHRKEIFALNLFLIFLIFNKYDSSKFINAFNIFYLFISTLIISLVHEGMTLMLFPFYLVVLKKYEISSNKNKLKFFYTTFTISLIVIVVINSGTEEISRLMFSNLHPEDQLILKDYSVDAIRAVGWTLKRALVLPIRILLSGNAFYWAFILFLMLCSIYIILFNNKFVEFKNFIVDFHKSHWYILISYSMFFIGWDWGRWFVVLFYLYIFTFMNLNFHSGYKYKSNSSILLVFIYISISLLTIIPECCLSWTDPKIFNFLEQHIGEIKINY